MKVLLKIYSNGWNHQNPNENFQVKDKMFWSFGKEISLPNRLVLWTRPFDQKRTWIGEMHLEPSILGLEHELDVASPHVVDSRFFGYFGNDHWDHRDLFS